MVYFSSPCFPLFRWVRGKKEENMKFKNKNKRGRGGGGERERLNNGLNNRQATQTRGVKDHVTF
jgi:hypothetical protein